MHNEFIPTEGEIYGEIEEVFSHGVRRPGYPADRWAEQHCLERFEALGLERVRAEPIELPYWEPTSASFSVVTDRGETTFDCFPLPHAAPTPGLEGNLVALDYDAPEGVRGRVALCNVRLGRLPFAALAARATSCYDPDGAFKDGIQVLPFGRGAQAVMEPAIKGGATAYVGTLTDYPSDSCQYYVPYDAVERTIPGVWVRGSDGARLRDMLSNGEVRARIAVDSVRRTITCNNIVGELTGADDEAVIIGSHHDGPWASAVEDGSGIALVLAQAAYWSRVPESERPHRLVFLLNAGHMAGGAGVHAFIETHRDELERVVLEVHLEHTANECVDEDGSLRATGQPEARWWFTSEIAALETAAYETLAAEDLRRSFVLPPNVFAPYPTTDGGPFHASGVPLVNFLTAPFYLFDEQDTLDKIHKPSLVPVTRAAVRLVEWTAGRSAAEMRSAARTKAD